MRQCILFFSLLAVLSISSFAQTREVGITVGARFTPNGTSPSGTTDVNTAFAFEASFAAQLASAGVGDVEVEVPLLLVPTSEINSSTLATAKSYSALYLLPGLRARLATGTVLSPWAAAGLGFVRFGPSGTNLAGRPSNATSSTKFGFDLGGGVDLRPKDSPFAFRFELRYLYTGVPSLGVPNLSMHNNLLVGGGVVLRF